MNGAREWMLSLINPTSRRWKDGKESAKEVKKQQPVCGKEKPRDEVSWKARREILLRR